jgi:glycine/D-amino acid oxidase-like deaminating enzyme
VIGGGIAGAGAALEAARRGVATMLVEARDFAWGSSSRSSKLVHGGLRYLEQLDLALVHEALQERGLLATRLAQADDVGDRLDEVYIPAVGGLAVRGVVPGQDPATGQLRLVSASGVAYGVRDPETAAALGIIDAVPAPEAVLRLLPAGPALDLAQARKTVDAVDGSPTAAEQVAGRTGG